MKYIAITNTGSKWTRNIFFFIYFSCSIHNVFLVSCYLLKLRNRLEVIVSTISFFIYKSFLLH